MLLDDGGSTGWLCWPRKLTGYSLESPTQDHIYSDASSQGSEQLLKGIWSDSVFWERILNFMSQENSGDSRETFNVFATLFYKRIFAQFGGATLPIIQPFLDQYIADVADKSKQRAATELIVGIVRGAKHWSASSKTAMWNVIIPLFRKGISGATTESVTYWGECITHICVSLNTVFPADITG